MIDAEFYSEDSLVTLFYKGSRKHYPIRPPSVSTEVYQKTLGYGESFINTSEAIFGKGLQNLWPYLCDCNDLRHPDDWNTGDSVIIPRVVVVLKKESERSLSV